jgi:NADPH-dependent 2,4-dienoyl-CoA reductase/sulfur reductase-like enzyme
MKQIEEPARKTPVRAEVDVLIVGAGPAGIMAAEAAADKGLKVMMIEGRNRTSCLSVACKFNDDWP